MHEETEPINTLDILKKYLELFESIERSLERQQYAEFMTIKEAAFFLRCSPSTIRELIKSNKVRYFRIGESAKSTILISRKDLKYFITKK